MSVPILYILARNDLASMNPGKLAAQASHASNAFVHHFHAFAQEQNSKAKTPLFEECSKAFYNWEHSTSQGFGTVIVLEGKMREINLSVKTLINMNYIAGIIHDPTYPILDGEVVHHVPLDTCGYVFIPDIDTSLEAKLILNKYPLYK